MNVLRTFGPNAQEIRNAPGPWHLTVLTLWVLRADPVAPIGGKRIKL